MFSGRGVAVETYSILVVHGRDFKPDAEPLSGLSMAALRAGIGRDFPDEIERFDLIRKEMAYYGDLTNALLQEQGRQYDEQLDIGDRRNALNQLRSINARKRFGIREYGRLPGKSALPEFVADVLAPVIDKVGLATPLLSRVSHDFAEYLDGTSSYAELARERVRSKLCAMLSRGDRVLLITHGTGSVIAYDVLWQLSHEESYKKDFGDAKIDTWLSLGSPLGVSIVQKRLLGAAGFSTDRCPTNVISWHNMAAEDDYACHDNTVADDFKQMLQQRVASTIRDYHVYNLTVRYGKSNPHSSIGYYIHPRTAKIVVDWMK
jgi:hypothetical protein